MEPCRRHKTGSCPLRCVRWESLRLPWRRCFCCCGAPYALPGGPVRAHLRDSARTIQQEGNCILPFFGFKLFQMDNYTDTLNADGGGLGR